MASFAESEAEAKKPLNPPSLPTPADLQPALEKLKSSPGSVVLIAIEQPEARCNFCRCTWAWMSKEERASLKAALERARKKRETSRDVGAGDLAGCESTTGRGPPNAEAA